MEGVEAQARWAVGGRLGGSSPSRRPTTVPPCCTVVPLLLDSTEEPPRAQPADAPARGWRGSEGLTQRLSRRSSRSLRPARRPRGCCGRQASVLGPRQRGAERGESGGRTLQDPVEVGSGAGAGGRRGTMVSSFVLARVRGCVCCSGTRSGALLGGLAGEVEVPQGFRGRRAALAASGHGGGLVAGGRGSGGAGAAAEWVQGSATCPW